MFRSPRLLLLLAFLVPFATACSSYPGAGGYPQAGGAIRIEQIAASPWDDGLTVATKMILKNESNAKVSDLRVTGIEVDGGKHSGPVALPIPLGDIAPGGDALLDAIFELTNIDGSARTLRVVGEFRGGYGLQRFVAQHTIRPDSRPPSAIETRSGKLEKQRPERAKYPEPPRRPPMSPNAETPMLIPIGPSRVVFPPTPRGTELGSSPAAAGVQIPTNSTMNDIGGVPPDPNAAAASPTGVSLVTWNTGISFSMNGGGSFTDIPLFSPQPGNPGRTSFFPQDDGGLCCDQVVVYLPQQNIFVWILQYWPMFNGVRITQTSRLRVAWATPQDAAADFWNVWTYCDLTAPGLGTAANEHLDYPDLAFSDQFLYVSVDRGWPNSPGQVYSGRRLVARLSLADMVNPAASSVGYSFAELSTSAGLNKAHFIQGARGRMVLGSLDNTSTMRVYTWPDSSGSIAQTTTAISSIQTAYTSVAPDGVDWYAISFPGNITGGAFRNRDRDEYLFAFDAGVNAGGGRPRAYLRLETLTPSGSNYTVAEEYDVWHPDYAYGMGALGSDGREIGITLAVGGGTIGYPQFAVGYKDDFVVFAVTSSNGSQAGGRFGDYVPNRLVPGRGLFFATGVYETLLPAGTATGTCATAACTTRMRFVQYGRTPD